MPVYRTPDARFEDLPDFPFAPHYLSLAAGALDDVPEGLHDLRLHYVDEGEGAPVLCLHGEPTWSYLYRHMIPPLAARHRVVVPDFIGFGRSDKLTDPDAYSFALHYDMLTAFVERLDLTDITLVVQDWGGVVGLPFAVAHPERVARIVVLNTFLPTGAEGEKSTAFLVWRRFVENNPDFSVRDVVQRGLAQPETVSDDALAAYDAPFPTPDSKAGAVAWPLLVPMTPDDPAADVMRATREQLADWRKPAFVLFSDEDPIMSAARDFFRDLIPTAAEQPDVHIEGAGHFLQEEAGPALAQHVLNFIDRTPV
jgi:haloalkane dehalogenase